MRKNKTHPKLQWTALKEEYFVGTLRVDGEVIEVNELADAIAAGELGAILKESAEMFHNGNEVAALNSFSRLVSSMKTNIKKAEYRPSMRTDIVRIELLEKFIASERAATATKPKWQWTADEITSLEEANSVYNNMASIKSKYPERIQDMDEFEDRFEQVSLKRTAMKKADALPDSLIDKLTSGKAILSKAEAEALLKLLRK